MPVSDSCISEHLVVAPLLSLNQLHLENLTCDSDKVTIGLSLQVTGNNRSNGCPRTPIAPATCKLINPIIAVIQAQNT